MRYAQYPGIPATGRPGVAEIGVWQGRQITNGYSEGIALDVTGYVSEGSGDFGMEIRLGYEIGKGGRRAISGGSVTGNLFDALANARFSADSQGFAQFAGPAAIRFESLQVAGEG